MVVGFDVGNENCIVAVARQRGIDCVLNEESKRETPCMVSFGEKQRFLGTQGAACALMNPKNTIAQIKRLIGRKFNDPELQADLPSLPFKVTEDANGDPVVNVQYLGEQRAFTPTQLLGMILSHLKGIAEKNLGTSIVDCVIGIPVFFTETQRRAYLDAAQIAGLNPLRLMHETTATALSWGIYKTDLPEDAPVHAAFVDVGHGSLQVCVVAFKKGQLKILAHGFDRNLGGRDFDEVLFDHFAEEFKEKYKIDVRTNAKASLRLRSACEKMKKVLSANPEAPLNIECLMEEKDVRSHMTRDKFEQLAAGVLSRVLAPCKQAVEDAGLSVDQISAVEVVGSGSRVPAVMKILTDFFKREPSRTMNASECVARGLGLQCAMLSPVFRVRDFQVQDAYPFPVCLSWKGGSAPSDVAAEDGEDAQLASNSIVFKRFNSLPSTKIVTFYRSESFSVDAYYADPSLLSAGAPLKIATFTVGPFTPSKAGEACKIKLKIKLNLHGVISVESATLHEEEEVEVPIPVVRKDESMETEGAKPDEASTTGSKDESDAKMEDAAAGNAEGQENGSKEDKMETEPAKEVAKKKKVKRMDVPVNQAVTGSLPSAELQKQQEKEYEMALQDRVMEETKDRKNEVEAYVYDMRNKLYERLDQYVTEAEREDLSSKLQQTEDWLYEDGEDETKGVYIAKLAELKKLGDPLEDRLREDQERPPALDSIMLTINGFREAAQSNDPKYEHIDQADKDKVVEECNKAAEWVRDKQQQQAALPKNANAVLMVQDIRKKQDTLDRFARPIMMKPRPPPPKAPSPAPAAPDAKPTETKNPFEEGKAGGEGAEPTPMETEASQEGEQPAKAES